MLSSDRLHTFAVFAEDNNLYGTGVNVAVRLEQLAQSGGICVSQTVYDQVCKIVEILFQDIGERRPPSPSCRRHESESRSRISCRGNLRLCLQGQPH